MVLSLLSVPLAFVHENHSKLPIKKMVWFLLPASVVCFRSFTENGVILLLKMHTHTHIIEGFASVWHTSLPWIRFFQKTFPFWICIIFGSLIYFPFHYSFSSCLWISLYLLSMESCIFLLLYYNLIILIPVSFFFVRVCMVESKGYKMRWGDSVSSRHFWARTIFSPFPYQQGTIYCML